MQGILTACAAAVFLLLPIQFIVLPLNMSVADVVGFGALPVCWIALLNGRRNPLLPLLPAMWGILGVTAVASLTSLDPGASFTVLVKEIYLYLWLVTICNVFAHADGKALRRLLLAWCVAAYANGFLILAQFVSPALLDTMNGMVAGLGKLDENRPSGLMENSNAAALFQLAAFVPLVALRLPRNKLLPAAIVLLATVLGTGSMGATLAFCTGLATALVALIVLFKDWRAVLNFVVVATLAVALMTVLVLILAQFMPGLNDRIDYVLTGRGEGSAESRFAIWARGVDILLGELRVCGIGPDVFKVLTGFELHNDVLSFTVERGPIGLVALIAFAVLVLSHALQLARWGRAMRQGFTVVFLAGLVALATVGMTHEIFHQRPVWLVLALQEAIWWRERRGQAALPRAGATDAAAHPLEVSATSRTASIT